ncbi:Ger(x)C family spore germination protein [Paenibacillus rigui]|uniref:Spore gernimation protein GerC n=1 Tax=Paenibacillus rigui TaxID=554312 RepID=A0A229UVG2_9BACL|nr:Ger(x)C family spore germination protein [Paenibacillus rigui]OXM86889.1 spore gernimation protein GerC [Paenibacillus rigui]
MKVSLLSKFAVLLCIAAFGLTGCWNAKDVDNLDYVNAVGIDYAKESKEYTVYLQLLSFQRVAKTEGGGIDTKPIPVWMAIGHGQTYAEAIGKITVEAEKRLFWGHVTSLILGEGLLEKGEITDVLQSMFRFYELRYTMWVFGTKEPIDKLFEASPNFERSRLNMIIHAPLDNYLQRSYIKPLRLHDFIADYYETAKTLVLPSIAISGKVWRINEKPIHSLRYNGIYVFWDKKNTGFLPLEKVYGLRWMEKGARRAPVLIEDDKLLANLRMEHPKHAIYMRTINDKPVFDVHVVVKGIISELNENVPVGTLIQQVETKIEKEIRDTYAAGLKQKADLLGLCDHLYLRGAKGYSKYAGDRTFLLHPDSLGKVTVDAQITTAGKYTYKLYKDVTDESVTQPEGHRLP